MAHCERAGRFYVYAIRRLALSASRRASRALEATYRQHGFPQALLIRGAIPEAHFISPPFQTYVHTTAESGEVGKGAFTAPSLPIFKSEGDAGRRPDGLDVNVGWSRFRLFPTLSRSFFGSTRKKATLTPKPASSVYGRSYVELFKSRGDRRAY